MSQDALLTIEKSVFGIRRRHRDFPCDLALILRLAKLIGGQINDSGNALLKTWGITYEEYGVMTTLYGSENYAMLVVELCHLVGARVTQVNRLIHQLDKQGLVIRSYDVIDRRRVVATLSDRGVTLIQEVLPVVGALARSAVQSFAPGELAELVRLLKKSVRTLA